MRYFFLSVVALLGLVAAAQPPLKIHPTPHELTYTGAGWHDLTAPLEVKAEVADKRRINKRQTKVPLQRGGYYLRITGGEAFIAGYDEEGRLNGLETLRQITQDGRACDMEIRDWPDVPFRGVVEGFYGTPWTHQARLDQFEFYHRHKLNVYLYGPKDDPYHSTPLWRQPYPAKEAAQLRELVEKAKACGVNFYWAIHPGQDFRWTEADRDSLLWKFEAMYDLGVRSFAVFFDDIWGEGTKAENQAGLLNYINEHFIHQKPDVAPLIMCPTEYNRAWVNEQKGYLRTLGETLAEDIEIMWTGNTVVHCIDRESMEWVNERIRRKAYIWWNFPVTDYCRDHLMLGPAYGNGKDIAPMMSGFVSNPMEHAEASKIALYGIAEYTWNMEAFEPNTEWWDALKELMPNHTTALSTFARYAQDAGPNGHRFRRDECETEAAFFADKTNKLTLADTLLYTAQYCRELRASVEELLACDENPQLLRELRPWLLQARLLADYGLTVCALGQELTDREECDRVDYFLTYYQAARALKRQMFDLENSDVRHPLQPGIKVGEKWLLPTLDATLASVVRCYNADDPYLDDLEADINIHPFTLKSDVPQLAAQPVTAKGNNVEVRPALEVVKWPAGASLTIECLNTVTLQGLDFNFERCGIASKLTLEVRHGATWQPVSLLHYKADDPVVHTGGELGGMQADALRLTNTSGEELEIKLNRFAFTTR